MTRLYFNWLYVAISSTDFEIITQQILQCVITTPSVIATTTKNLSAFALLKCENGPDCIDAGQHVGNKNGNIQVRSLNVIKVIFHTIKNYS